MLSIKKIRENKDKIEKSLQKKDPSIDLTPLYELDKEIRNLQTSTEKLKSEKNKISKEIGIKKSKNEDISNILKDVSNYSEKITSQDSKLKQLEAKREHILLLLPNTPYDDIPFSLDPKDNVCIKTFKEKTTFDFPFKNHLELSEKLHLFDFDKGAKIAGSGFPLYKNFGARLEWALLNYMLDIHIKNGFTQIIPPILTKENIMQGSGQLPKFKDQIFKIDDKDYNLYLLPTAEVALNGMHYGSIIEEASLPLKYVSYTPCFRREAGAAGKNERGLIRTHQFNKVELFCFSTPDKSDETFDIMMKSAEEVLEGLDLHYKNMLLVTGDMSFASAKTIDIEVWLPGQNRYYEVSSVSNCTDYQARRSSTRYKKTGDSPEFLHTLNGSGVATSRLMVALLENNQQQDGSVIIPKVLHKYLSEEIQTITPYEG